jgi:hypothetical protein
MYRACRRTTMLVAGENVYLTQQGRMETLERKLAD